MNNLYDIKSNSIVLFQGDSITDVNRDRNDPTNLGFGYPMMAAASYQSMYPEDCVQFLNRGISGDRTIDLRKRWQQDCIDIHPDVITILVGLNDTWRRFDSNDPTSVEDFEENYRELLNEIRYNTDARVILMEPFLLPVPEFRRQWREDLDPKIHVVRNLAVEFEVALIPLDGIFAQAATRRDADFWSADGVHPTAAGHALIARTWLETVDELNIL